MFKVSSWVSTPSLKSSQVLVPVLFGIWIIFLKILSPCQAIPCLSIVDIYFLHIQENGTFSVLGKQSNDRF